MSEFEVKVVRIDEVSKHPNADRLSLNRVGGYTCISNLKDDGSFRYAVGDLAVYVPADTVIPENVLKRIGFWKDTDREGNPLPVESQKGMLAGKRGDRVKPMKLREIFSEGILIPLVENKFLKNGDEILEVTLGQDVAEFFSMIKYEPPIPTCMSGEVFNAGGAGMVPVKYDIEAWEKHTDVLRVEPVVVTEKLHGTYCGIGLTPHTGNPEAFESLDNVRDVIVYSKGLGSSGLCFKDVTQNAGNLYVRAYKSLNEDSRVALRRIALDHNGVHLLGEVFGQGVQDLHYGQKSPTFRVFDIYLGSYPTGRYANDEELESLLSLVGIPRVPVLGKFEYSVDAVMALRDGKDTISDSNIREGVVVRPLIERRDQYLGRVQLKFVSPDYKLRRGNVTENS